MNANAAPVAAQPPQAHRLAHDHPFEDRAPLLSRRASPNDPSDQSVAAPVPRLSPGTESYPRRVAQVEMADSLRSPHEMCACPSTSAQRLRLFAEVGIDAR